MGGDSSRHPGKTGVGRCRLGVGAGAGWGRAGPGIDPRGGRLSAGSDGSGPKRGPGPDRGRGQGPGRNLAETGAGPT